MPNTIAFIAHDHKKDELVALVQQYEGILSRYQAIATGNTGNRILEQTNLEVECLLPGALGGDVQIAAQVAIEEIAAVIFLIDPAASTQEPAVQNLLRICAIHNVPLATNKPTVRAVITFLNNKKIAHLIFNPISGQGNPELDLILIKRLLSPEIQLNVILTKPEIEPGEQAKDAIQEGADLVIASGGDGTISAVAAAVIGTDIPLGIIPRGTANAFSVALGIPTNVNAACEVILAGSTRVVDVALC